MHGLPRGSAGLRCADRSRDLCRSDEAVGAQLGAHGSAGVGSPHANDVGNRDAAALGRRAAVGHHGAAELDQRRVHGRLRVDLQLGFELVWLGLVELRFGLGVIELRLGFELGVIELGIGLVELRLDFGLV
jgi:hypothetical protein